MSTELAQAMFKEVFTPLDGKIVGINILLGYSDSTNVEEYF